MKILITGAKLSQHEGLVVSAKKRFSRKLSNPQRLLKASLPHFHVAARKGIEK